MQQIVEILDTMAYFLFLVRLHTRHPLRILCVEQSTTLFVLIEFDLLY